MSMFISKSMLFIQAGGGELPGTKSWRRTDVVPASLAKVLKAMIPRMLLIAG